MIVVHANPGEIDPRAFQVFGMNAKPNTESPIGYFGTGLKYAIAVLVRHGIEPKLFIGRDEYVFYVAKTSFRDKSFQQVKMKKRSFGFLSWNYHTLPFTTELGKNWELWQAYRELHSNALDEGGGTNLLSKCFPERGETRFCIEDSRYQEVWNARDSIFLSDDQKAKVIHQTRDVQVLRGASQFVYYRGLQIMKLRKPSQFTYNFLCSVDLTEDRTAKHPHWLEGQIAAAIQASEDKAFLKRTITNPPANSYERSMSFGLAHYHSTPSRGFVAAAKAAPNPTVREIWDQAQPTIPSHVDLIVRVPLPDIAENQLTTFEGLVKSMWQQAELIRPRLHTELWGAPNAEEDPKNAPIIEQPPKLVGAGVDTEGDDIPF